MDGHEHPNPGNPEIGGLGKEAAPMPNSFLDRLARIVEQGIAVGKAVIAANGGFGWAVDT